MIRKSSSNRVKLPLSHLRECSSTSTTSKTTKKTTESTHYFSSNSYSMIWLKVFRAKSKNSSKCKTMKLMQHRPSIKSWRWLSKCHFLNLDLVIRMIVLQTWMSLRMRLGRSRCRVLSIWRTPPPASTQTRTSRATSSSPDSSLPEGLRYWIRRCWTNLTASAPYSCAKKLDGPSPAMMTTMRIRAAIVRVMENRMVTMAVRVMWDHQTNKSKT